MDTGQLFATSDEQNESMGCVGIVYEYYEVGNLYGWGADWEWK